MANAPSPLALLALARTPIVLSLRNFVFHQGKPWTDRSTVLRIAIVPDRTMALAADPRSAP